MYKGTIIEKNSADVESVKLIKAQLNKLIGSTLDSNNGNFGNSTELVVKQFQVKMYLLDDGKVGELTWTRLFDPESSKIVNISKAQDGTINVSLKALEIASSQLHVRELTNRNDGVDVEKYLKSVGLPKGYAWCMAFVFWCFEQASKSLNIKNPVPKTAGVMDCYAKAKSAGRKISKSPKKGDQFIMDFGKGTGHTGLVTESKTTTVFTIEGNTSASPTSAVQDRDGGGVFERNRSISSILVFISYS